MAYSSMWNLWLATFFAAAGAVLVESHYPEGTTYNIVYAVNDPLTHDIKVQWERRIGDKVQGSYRLAEADGTIRIVDYYADGKNGFNAIVRREGQAYHNIAIPVQPYQNVVQVQPVQTVGTSSNREYFGATFVQDRNYGRGLGFLN